MLDIECGCRWVPTKERSRSLALVYSGMYSGSILGLALSPHMVEVLSWPSVFYLFGAVGILWYALWQSKAASSPASDDSISTEERNYIEETSVIAVSQILSVIQEHEGSVLLRFILAFSIHLLCSHQLDHSLHRLGWKQTLLVLQSSS